MKPDMDRCRYCGADLRFTSYEFYRVIKKVKPTGRGFRNQCIGVACTKCVEHDNKPAVIDPWRDKQ